MKLFRQNLKFAVIARWNRIRTDLDRFGHDRSEHIWQLRDRSKLVGDLLAPLLFFVKQVHLIDHSLEDDLKSSRKKTGIESKTY